MTDRARIVVGIGADRGLEYGLGLLTALRAAHFDTHVVVAGQAAGALDSDLESVREQSTQLYAGDNQAAAISSGSFLTCGMVVAPCGAHTLSAIVRGLAQDLLLRAADVTLKEARPLLLGLVAPDTVSLREDVERAHRVPRLLVTALEGPAEPAVADLIAQISTWRS